MFPLNKSITHTVVVQISIPRHLQQTFFIRNDKRLKSQSDKGFCCTWHSPEYLLHICVVLWSGYWEDPGQLPTSWEVFFHQNMFISSFCSTCKSVISVPKDPRIAMFFCHTTLETKLFNGTSHSHCTFPSTMIVGNLLKSVRSTMYTFS